MPIRFQGYNRIDDCCHVVLKVIFNCVFMPVKLILIMVMIIKAVVKMEEHLISSVSQVAPHCVMSLT
ncbi:hypothetical protein RhiirA5_430463 [Rhizophagus irregularis]|uniref:Uncharacterized protein n=1 Tax=Rhizophagus irregularis TaxID=588596 RepID=A0A2I1F2B5_9GLOM|nr:hypothetical protein RhiirA5_430463 [Rhizophagus irregularis]PKC52790.1 hypothetical protein RhiirA1_480675 [Rhizophagus irregularis]PKY28506.1 hypothetical protein RhiirB3_444703 [Rhizophagus irregularis]